MQPEVDRRREALIRAGLTLASELSLPVVLQKLTELACLVADARYGALGVLDRSGRRIERFVTHGVTSEERRAIGDLPRGRGILGVLIREARPLRLDRIRDDPRSVGFPPHHPVMTSFLGVPIMVRGNVFGNLYLTEKRGGDPFTEEDEEAVMTLATQAGVAVENARLYQEARAARERLEAIGRVTAAILEGREIDEVLRLIADRARDLAGGDLASVSVPVGGGRLGLRVVVGELADQLEGEEYEAEGSIAEEVMRTGRPLLIPDLSEDPRKGQPVVRIGRIGPGIYLPLSVGDRRFGTLLVANLLGGRSFDRDDADVVRMFAAQAAVALEYARFREELQRLAVLEDRERIAQELHDGVIQSLFAVGMSLQATAGMAEDPETSERLNHAVDAVDGAIRDLRNYIFGLRPGALADRQLAISLEELTKSFDESTGLTVIASIDRDVAARLVGRETEVLQAAREAISNAVRHSGGETVRVSLRQEGQDAILEVADDGSGFDPAHVEGRGQGLGNLLHRADSLGGRLQIISDEGGTTVRITLPL
ncbi:MAG TPA: GAF domain-containing sensor histidine kinase [Actinomycetota bacterium]